MGYKEFEKKMNYLLESLNHEKYSFYTENKINYLENKTVAIDFTHNIHKALRKTNIHYLVHIMNLFKKLNYYNIKMILVFDGKPPKEKNNEIYKKKKKDKKVFTELQALIKQVEEFNKINIENSKVKNEYIEEEKKECELKIKRNQSKLVKVKKNVKDDIKEFCDLFNIPYIHKDTEEADPICSYLVRNNIADVCITNDYDLIGYQCPIIIKDLEYLSDEIKVIDIYKLSSMLKFDNIDKLSFLLILFGNDYMNISPRINIVEIHSKLIHHSINEVMEMYKDFLDKEKVNNILYNIYLKKINVNNFSKNINDNKFVNREKFIKFNEKYKENKELVQSTKMYYKINDYYFNKYEF